VLTMICCLNPDCDKPHNPDNNKHCQNCGVPLIPLLRHRYKIIRPLGQGGFGKTYLAEDTDKLNEPCVVKQLAYQGQGTWANQKAKQLFEQEAKQLQQLGEHSQIPTLFAYFQEDNYLYLVQQCIEGQDLLKELQQEGVFSEAKIRSLFLDLLPVLKFIHDRHTIHRDLKPENIMRRQRDYRLVLIDFGVAKMLATSVIAYPKGTSLGSHGYAPIEQLKEGNATAASDLFSLGATCFHLLTNIPPFQLWVEQGYSWVTNWQQHLPQTLSTELINVLDKLLQKDINQRYQSAEDVLHDLQPQPSSTQQSSTPSPSPSQASHSPVTAQPASSSSSPASTPSTVQAAPSGNSHSPSSSQSPPQSPTEALQQKKIVTPTQQIEQSNLTKRQNPWSLSLGILLLAGIAAAIVALLMGPTRFLRSPNSPVTSADPPNSPAPANSPSNSSPSSPSSSARREIAPIFTEPLQANTNILVLSSLARPEQAPFDRQIVAGSVVREAARQSFRGELWVQLKVCDVPATDVPPESPVPSETLVPSSTPTELKDLSVGEAGWIPIDRYQASIGSDLRSDIDPVLKTACRNASANELPPI
jgi:serine/threonine protein kinase